jgi:hypothetical protein
VTDPLRPFAQIIRTLWRSKTQAGKTAGESTLAASESSRLPHDEDNQAEGSLRAHLSARIGGVSPQDARQIREKFVETVLLWELGDHLARDPAFGEVVSHVSQQLAADPVVSRKLHGLLVQLAQTRGLDTPRR